MYIDTHAHLTFPEFAADLPEVIKRAQEAGLEAIVNIALDDQALEQSLALSAKYPGYVQTAAGIHPQEAKEYQESEYEKFATLVKQKQIVAIGETGLDYHYKLSPVKTQQAVFRRFLQLCQAVDKPAIIHVREAAEDALRILREENKGKLKGVLHCFAGDMTLGQGALDMGLHISFTANITYPKAHNLREAVKTIPLDRIMIETDSPFLAPQEFRGKRNEPAYVVKVAEQIAAVKGLTVEAVAQATTRNSKQLFLIG
ncbi:MAG: TatD family hydrolase [Candidatus Margulisbacteria bacterium]|jgi:TatD DNase family protein|nr:TatD family hydrolase [Candidatus Margulisiibacteriota bacterium]